ncbi:MAG: HDOD domain-containing protein, partial [bacterium]|nr:HDOD domain-containing protein [bacterium]
FKEFPLTAAYAMGVSKKRRVPLFQVERELFKYDHSAVAGLLLEKWNFHIPLIRMVKYHHTPLSAPKPLPPSIIHISTFIANALKFGGSGDIYVPPFNGKTWDTIELSTSVLSPSITQTDRQVSEILQAFSLDEK